MSDQPVKTINDLQPGDHLCLVYDTEQEHRDVLTAFVREGLRRGEKVMYFADAHTPALLLDYLSNEPNLGRSLQSGQLQVLTADQVYLRDGRFDVDRTIRLLTAELDQALKEGYPALRVTGEMTWAFGKAPGVKQLFEYESRVNEFFTGRPAIGLCQYRHTFAPEALFHALLTHPLAARGSSLVNNRSYVPPDEFLRSADRTQILNRLSAQLAWHPSTAEPARLHSSDIDSLLRALGLPPSP